MKKIVLSKLEVMAIRGEEWLFSIITLPDSLPLEVYMDNVVDKAKDKEAFIFNNNRTKWQKFWGIKYEPKEDHYYRRLDEVSDKISKFMREEKTKKNIIWKNIRSKYIMTDIKMGGSRQDRLITIQDIGTSKLYQGFCNNYGGDNPLIQFEEIE